MDLKNIIFLDLENYADVLSNFECADASLKDLLELGKDMEFINHMYNVVSDEDFDYNDQIQFVDQFDEYLGTGQCTLYRENIYWDRDLFDYDGMVGDFATFSVGANRYVLRLEEMEVVMTGYTEKFNFLVDKYIELVGEEI